MVLTHSPVIEHMDCKKAEKTKGHTSVFAIVIGFDSLSTEFH